MKKLEKNCYPVDWRAKKIVGKKAKFIITLEVVQTDKNASFAYGRREKKLEIHWRTLLQGLIQLTHSMLLYTFLQRKNNTFFHCLFCVFSPEVKSDPVDQRTSQAKNAYLSHATTFFCLNKKVSVYFGFNEKKWAFNVCVEKTTEEKKDKSAPKT